MTLHLQKWGFNERILKFSFDVAQVLFEPRFQGLGTSTQVLTVSKSDT